MKAIQEDRNPAAKAKSRKWSDRDDSPSENTNMNIEAVDCVDALPEKLTFTIVDILILIISIGSYLFDTGSDIVVAHALYKTDHLIYFALTVTFILLPAIVMAGFSMKWYITDKKLAEDEGMQNIVTPVWILRLVGVCLHLGPVIRYMTSLYYGIKFRRSKNSKLFYHLMVNEDADAALLRLFECFMEAGPQLLLQIYILAVETSYQDGHWLIVSTQVFSIMSSLFSMAWSLVSYHRTLRISLQSKCNISLLGSFTQLLWHLFTISSRVLALALFASQHPIWFVVFCVTHWGIMTLWIISMKTEFCESKCGELVYNAVLGVIYLFCYFNAVDSPTRFRYTAYYIINFVENSIFIFVWYYTCNPTLWYRHAALAAQISAFFIGLVFMLLYYLLLHPVGNIAVKICSKSNHCRSDHELDEDGAMVNSNGGNKRLGRLDVVTTPGDPVPTQYVSDNTSSVNPTENTDAVQNNGFAKKTAIETAV